MKALVIFDSATGNTEKIAHAIALGIGSDARAVRVGSAASSRLEGTSLVVLGSPTQGGRPTEAMQRFLDALPSIPAGIEIATFDTRLKMKFVRLFGFAADKMRGYFARKGISAKDEPAGFIVNGRRGPLADGELQRAEQWGKRLGGGR